MKHLKFCHISSSTASGMTLSATNKKYIEMKRSVTQVADDETMLLISIFDPLSSKLPTHITSNWSSVVGVYNLSRTFCYSLNLCLKTPDSMQKESAQSNHPTWRKRPKCAQILRYYDVGPKQQNRTTFWTFSSGRVVGLS